MNLRLVVPLVAALAIAAALPASACDGNKKTATASASMHSCFGMSNSTAWAGAWLKRSTDGGLTVVAIAEGSPAARSGLKKGDVVLAVNGRDLNAEPSEHLCSDGSVCTVGSSFAYTVQRGKATKTVKMKLEKMPAEAATRFANVDVSYEPSLAAPVIATID